MCFQTCSVRSVRRGFLSFFCAFVVLNLTILFSFFVHFKWCSLSHRLLNKSFFIVHSCSSEQFGQLSTALIDLFCFIDIFHTLLALAASESSDRQHRGNQTHLSALIVSLIIYKSYSLTQTLREKNSLRKEFN